MWELAHATGDSELLETAYAGWTRWDGWLRRYRNTRGTGRCEGFCTWDTGHDNSPRWTGLPHNCPDDEARNVPPVASLPRLSPDLSATVYGGRVALAAMARALAKNADANRWLDDAEIIRKAVMTRLYSADDAAFYDVDAQDRIVRVRGDVISRVLSEHVVDQSRFETILETTRRRRCASRSSRGDCRACAGQAICCSGTSGHPPRTCARVIACGSRRPARPSCDMRKAARSCC